MLITKAQSSTLLILVLLVLYVLECLGGEPRIERIESVDIDPRPLSDRGDTVKVTIRLLPKGQKDPLVLVVPFEFETTIP